VSNTELFDRGLNIIFFKKNIHADFYDIFLHTKKIPNRILKVQIK